MAPSRGQARVQYEVVICKCGSPCLLHDMHSLNKDLTRTTLGGGCLWIGGITEVTNPLNFADVLRDCTMNQCQLPA